MEIRQLPTQQPRHGSEKGGQHPGRQQIAILSDTYLPMEPQTKSDDRSPLQLEGGGLFSAHDLALCSSEEARALLPYESALRLLALPIVVERVKGGLRLHCAVADDDAEVGGALRFLTDAEPILTVAPREVLQDALVRAYIGSGERLAHDIKRLSRTSPSQTRAALSEVPKAEGDAAKFLSNLLDYSVARSASDLHLCPSPAGAFIRIRVDGELLSQEGQHYPRALHEQVVSRLKVLSGLDIACKRLPQDGACTIRVGLGMRSIRISTLPTVDGESVVVRFLYARKLPQLNLLGFEPVAMSRMRSALSRSNGVVLLTGPTGSGKTTTMYSVAIDLQHRGRNVVSVEDPVEAPIPGMVQVQVHEQQGLDFPRAIRSILRHDPDVILIGEMRDAVSARMALSAAVTGHLTISSLHMGSALQALERLRSFDLSAREAVEAVSLVINQRLTPRLCSKCKTVDLAGTERFKRTVYKPAGCSTCGDTGFKGRVLITETLDLLSPTVKDAYSRAHTIREALSLIPSSAFVPWTQALEFHLSRGDLSAQQVQEFVDQEMVNE